MQELRAQILFGIVFSLMCGDGHAAVRHIRYSYDMQDYDLRYDTKKLAGYNMDELVWLSTWYQPPAPVLFDYGVGDDGSNHPYKQLAFYAIEGKPQPLFVLERNGQTAVERQGEPGSPQWRDYLRRNLNFGKTELNRLESMKVPPVLEPVRKYMIHYLKGGVTREEGRYNFATTGDIDAIINLLCSRCKCGRQDESLMHKLHEAHDPAMRLKLTSGEWTNRMIRCQSGVTYPIENWNLFLRQYGIVETHREKGPE